MERTKGQGADLSNLRPVCLILKHQVQEVRRTSEGLADEDVDDEENDDGANENNDELTRDHVSKTPFLKSVFHDVDVGIVSA